MIVSDVKGVFWKPTPVEPKEVSRTNYVPPQIIAETNLSSTIPLYTIPPTQETSVDVVVQEETEATEEAIVAEVVAEVVGDSQYNPNFFEPPSEEETRQLLNLDCFKDETKKEEIIETICAHVVEDMDNLVVDQHRHPSTYSVLETDEGKEALNNIIKTGSNAVAYALNSSGKNKHINGDLIKTIIGGVLSHVIDKKKK
jgi:hypothetical protein